MRYRNAISYAILLVIAYDIKDIANAIKKISHEISLRYRNDAISHAISHLSRIQMYAYYSFYATYATWPPSALIFLQHGDVCTFMQFAAIVVLGDT